MTKSWKWCSVAFLATRIKAKIAEMIRPRPHGRIHKHVVDSATFRAKDQEKSRLRVRLCL